jgi:probable phosphoglycerate mutase
LTEALHPEEAVTSLILIRHGHTVHTEAGKLYSEPAATLTEKGHQEAQAIGNWLPSEKPDLLLTSPSVRARATAEAIAAFVQLPVVIAEEIYQWQVGSWDGRSYLEIKKAEPEVYESWVRDPIRNAPPGGESIEQLCTRSVGNIAKLCASYAGKTLALVTHAEVVRAFLVNALGMPVDNFWRLNIPTASATKVDFSANFATVQYVSLRPQLFA